MATQKLASTMDVVTDIVGPALPVAPDIFNGGTRLTPRYVHKSFEAYVPAMSDHILVAQCSPGKFVWTKVDGKDDKQPVVPGTITVMPRGHDSERASPDALQVSAVFLSHERLMACADQFGFRGPRDLIDRNSYADQKLFGLLKLLADEVETQEPRSGLFIEQVLDIVCLQVLRSHSAATMAPVRNYGGLAAWQIKRVTAYMQANLDQEIGLQELADLLSLSRFHFCTAFRKATGDTPHQWLIKLRMEKAIQLLVGTALSVTEIALAIGYQTPSAFTAAFRQRYGATPSAFRAS